MRVGLPVALLTAVFVYGCVAPRERAPAPPPVTPAPVAQPRPAPVPAPTPVQPRAAWADLPDTPGAWAYSADSNSSTAAFSSEGGRVFGMTCLRGSRRLRLERPGAAVLTVQTSYGVQQLPASAPAEIASTSPLLDQMAFSRGHFTVDAPGQPRLVLPAHPEVARVVEDCRA